MKKKHKEAFPNYSLSKEEIEWIEKFERFAGLYPIGTFEVADKRAFLQMIERNNEHVMECARDVVYASYHEARRLSYFDDFI